MQLYIGELRAGRDEAVLLGLGVVALGIEATFGLARRAPRLGIFPPGLIRGGAI